MVGSVSKKFSDILCRSSCVEFFKSIGSETRLVKIVLDLPFDKNNLFSSLNLYHRSLADLLEISHSEKPLIQVQLEFCPNLTNSPVYINEERLGINKQDLLHSLKDKFKLYNTVALGGTFDRFHHGHSLLLGSAALISSKNVYVGITSDLMVKNKYMSDFIQPYEVRDASVKNFFKHFNEEIVCKTFPLVDPVGLAGEAPEIDTLILTEETCSGIELVRTKRLENGVSEVDYHVIKNMIKPSDSVEWILKPDKLSSSALRLNESGMILKQPKYEFKKLKPYIIGVTGCIASGKSSVSSKLSCVLQRKYKIMEINCDLVSHEVYVKGTDCYKALIKEFGDKILDSSTGQVDRKALGAIVFSSEEMLNKLNEVVWFYTVNMVESMCENSTAEIIIIEVALLYEADWQDKYNEIWLTWVNQNEAVNRIMKRNNLSKDAALTRYKASTRILSNREKIFMANVVIPTHESEDITMQIIERAVSEHTKIFEDYFKNRSS